MARTRIYTAVHDGVSYEVKLTPDTFMGSKGVEVKIYKILHPKRKLFKKRQVATYYDLFFLHDRDDDISWVKYCEEALHKYLDETVIERKYQAFWNSDG